VVLLSNWARYGQPIPASAARSPGIRITSMRLGKANHLHHALSLIGISVVYGGADFLIRRQPITGIALTLTGASWSAAWIIMLPRIHLWNLDLTPLIRFWLLVVLCGGTSVFLVQKYYDEPNHMGASMPVPPDDKTRAPWCPAPFRCE
jgi:hypothetical protein